jgi:hypothetical protein
MLKTPFAIKFGVAIAVWTIASACWAIINDPDPTDHFSTKWNITVTGSDSTYKGQSGTLYAYKWALGGQKLQTCGFFTNATDGKFQKSSADPAKPVLQAPPWDPDIRLYIEAMLDNQTRVGITYC